MRESPIELLDSFRGAVRSLQGGLVEKYRHPKLFLFVRLVAHAIDTIFDIVGETLGSL